MSLPTPAYWHLPVVVNSEGQKLSKQTGAAPISQAAADTAARLLELLGLAVPRGIRGEPPAALWQWALQHWRIEALHGQRTIAAAKFE